MKLWSAIFVICLLASTAQGVFAVQEQGTDTGSESISEAPMNPDYIANKNSFQPIEWIKQILSQEQLGYIPEPADSSHLKGKKISKKALEAAVQGIADVSAGDGGEILSAPSTYDLRTVDRVSPVKNQGSCGSCWAFASYGSMESEALTGQLYDFSENNLKNTHGFDYAACSGGNAQMATAYLARWSGAVAEADDPYVSSSTTSPTGLPVQEHVQEILMIPGRSGPLDNDNIKAALQTTGALYTTMYWSTTYYNASSKAYYYSGTSGSNHAVTIVGWDDTYSRANFLSAPPGDGAFIIKNSWGTSWGNNGYFYISYYDSKVGKSLTAFTGDPAENYNHIYQYDPLGWISSMGYGSNTAWAANVFTATSSEAVSAVGLSTNQVNTAYQISIYTNPTSGPLSSAGPVTTISGTIGIPGYHTVTLPTPVAVNAGQKFSVVARVQTPNYNYPITIEKPFSGYSSQATASAGQSYISSTGTSWTDLTTSNPNANACLKAYTVNTGAVVTPPVAGFTMTPTSGVAPLAVTFTDISANSPASWLWTFGDSSTSTVKSPSHTYTAAGTYTVTLKVTNAGGTSTLTRYLTVNAPAVAPVTSFTGSPTSGVAPLVVTFTDTSTNTPSSWLWTFGDGGTSADRNPSHTYTATGSYTVSLTTANSGGSSTWSTTNFITVTTPTPTAVITVTAPNGGESWVPGTTPTIKWTSSGSVGSYVKIELLKAGVLSHTISASTYNDDTFTSWTIPSTLAAGTDYRIRITSTSNAAIADTSDTSFTITSASSPTPTPVPVKASFSGTPLSGNPPLMVTFTDTSSGNPDSWEWNFGDGGTSTLQSPTHAYSAAGTYTVTLTVKNANGSSTVVKRNYIRVQAIKILKK